ncbi:ATP-binding cassette sub-family G member 4-like isoform X2 [Uranotaenia lowii]|nr:ATP-binding cassette sub-family G member 4-like isoform X2 [Uranotaenia lowii]
MVVNDLKEVVVPLVNSTEKNAPTVLSFKNLSFSVGQRSKSKLLLDNVSGSFRSGRLTAIIGPSGAGKSTLLNVLSGFNADGISGQILVNNKELSRRKYRQIVAYNEQEVDLLPNITVRETLAYAADLKLPSSVGKFQKQKIVSEIINLLGMERCANNQARVLSGGERKRLSIGQELVSNPKIMFFDEPTSGLDSKSSFQVISYLKTMAQQGRCVVSVIHQPSSDLLELFDDAYVVTEGQCLYRGSLTDMIPTFAEVGIICPQYYNRADFAIKIASKTTIEPDKIEKLMKKMEDDTSFTLMQNGTEHQNGSPGPGQEVHRKSQYPTSQWYQFAILTHRTALGTVRNFMLTALRFTVHVLFGFVVGFVYYNIGNDADKVIFNVSFCMVVLLFIVFANAMTVVLTYPLEMAVFVREYKSNCYSTTAYFFSKVVADFPLMIAGVSMFSLIVCYISGQPTDLFRMLMVWSMCCYMGWFSQVYGMLGGSIFPIDVSPFVIPATLIPLVLFSGFFVRLGDLPVVFQPFTWISPFRYTFEGVVVALYGYNRTYLDCSEIFCYYRKPIKILEMLNMENSSYWMDFTCLVVVIFLLHVMLLLSLWWRLR